jgi:hypothetical protein
VSDEELAVPTVRTRLAAILSDERVEMHMANGVVLLDHVVVTDLDTPAPEGTRIVIGGS